MIRNRVLLRSGTQQETCFDEFIQVSVKNPVSITDLHLGPQIFDHPVRMKNIGSDYL
jgi:hypothetical protein